MKDKTGKLIVISAPSGTGKTTVVKKLLEKIPNIAASVSFTTRPMRENEREGIDYFFVDKRKFESMVDSKQFIEHATVFGNYYGTQKKSLLIDLKKGINVILEIDWQGAQQVKEKMPSCIMIFLIPPSKEVLLSRLKNRGTDSKREIENRFNQAVSDLNESNKFDYVLVNDQIEVAVENISLCIEGNLNKLNQSELVDKALKSFYETN
ncbi:MAG: guanylate kinase [Gammaproteobacteria bacterium]|nr:guanylate kinase [Gammaproteobacteria bacterium]OUT95121.1 MAG: guanylate kinase [Gammaproteobacteria bacterium TMED36]|tara:strand:- start:414 stop:1037 length:624 start_codon:yes stop_codon:yes gene_type:complete